MKAFLRPPNAQSRSGGVRVAEKGDRAGGAFLLTDSGPRTWACLAAVWLSVPSRQFTATIRGRCGASHRWPRHLNCLYVETISNTATTISLLAAQFEMFRRLNNLGWNHHQEFDGLYDRAAKITGLDDGTLRQFASMADNFELLWRHNNLSYTHHKEVASIKPIIELRNGKLKLGAPVGLVNCHSTGGGLEMNTFVPAAPRGNRHVNGTRVGA